MDTQTTPTPRFDTRDPNYDERAHMEDAIRSGGSVSWRGRIITRLENLPSRAELAGDNPAKRAEAVAEIERKQRELDDQLQQLLREQHPTLVTEPAPQAPVVEAWRSEPSAPATRTAPATTEGLAQLMGAAYGSASPQPESEPQAQATPEQAPPSPPQPEPKPAAHKRPTPARSRSRGKR